ncbi:MAG: carbonic anhydrase [Alphaproteobacteria bacterium]
MVIACADSRVDPATIFSARPGELFILRNVANLVPSPSGRGSRSLGAALAFAVGTLCVSDIVVMGHGGCGGIAACLQMHDGVDHSADHVAEWMQEALPARHEVDRMHPGAGGDARQRLLEHVAIIHSLANLAAYPPVPTALAAGRLRLHGAWFSIGEGLLEWLDEESGRFVPVPEVAAGPA